MSKPNYIQEQRWISSKEVRILSEDEFFSSSEAAAYIWLDVQGEEDHVIESLQEKYGLHAQIIKNIQDTSLRTRVQVFDSYLSLVLKHLEWEEEEGILRAEHICYIIGPNVVMSFQELTKDSLASVKEQIQSPQSKARTLGPPFLLVLLIRNSFRKYFDVLAHFNEDLEDLEEAISSDPQQAQLTQIQNLKKAVLKVRKAIFPMQEILKTTFHSEGYALPKRIMPHIVDLQSQASQIWDMADAIYQQLTVLQDLYLGLINHRTNEIVRLLTLFSAIFLPLGFLAGVFGMNFDLMPGIHHPNGFWFLLASWIAISGGMLVYFWRKKWL